MQYSGGCFSNPGGLFSDLEDFDLQIVRLHAHVDEIGPEVGHFRNHIIWVRHPGSALFVPFL